MDSSSFQKDLCPQAGAMSLTQKQSLSGVEALPVVEVAVKDQVRPLSVQVQVVVGAEAWQEPLPGACKPT